MSVNIDVKDLLKAGAHFGHKTSRWHPKMAPYIHSKRGGSHIIDLIQTAERLETALAFLTEIAAGGKQILFVGTKRQAVAVVEEAAAAVKMPYVSQRWLGGMLTNSKTMKGRIKRLKELESKMESGEYAQRYSKLEVLRLQEEMDRLKVMFDGVKEISGAPGAVYVTDVVHDAIAVKEANKLGIPVVGIVDSNADPSDIAYPIPANDDAIKTLALISKYVVEAIAEGKLKKKVKPQPVTGVKRAVPGTGEVKPTQQEKSKKPATRPAKPVKKAPTKPAKPKKPTAKKEKK